MTTQSVETYYRVLGISDQATINEIKRAYRQRAMLIHPDKNNSATAHNDFILLSEAYEYLTNYQGRALNHETASSTYTDWNKQARNEARERAAEYAKMQYEDYIKSDFYKKSSAASVVFDHFYLFSSLLIILGAPIAGLLYKGFAGLLMGLLFVFLSVHYWAGIFSSKIEVNFKSLCLSIILILKTKTFLYIFSSLLNAFILFRFTLSSEISTLNFAIILSILFFSAFMVSNYISRKIKSISRTLLLLCILPSLFNLFFLINYIFATNPTTETYSFVHEKRSYGRGFSRRPEKIAYINLENNMYQQNHWFRMFSDYESMKNANRISYKFKTGLFGIRILKSFEFTIQE